MQSQVRESRYQREAWILGHEWDLKAEGTSCGYFPPTGARQGPAGRYRVAKARMGHRDGLGSQGSWGSTGPSATIPTALEPCIPLQVPTTSLEEQTVGPAAITRNYLAEKKLV